MDGSNIVTLRNSKDNAKLVTKMKKIKKNEI